MSSDIKRKLAAIMFTDIVAWAKMMREDEATALSILENQESILNPLFIQNNGNIIKKTGDGYLVEFNSSVEAVECALKIQESIKEYNTIPENIEFHIRIGIHLGDIVIIKDDIIGDGVNIASRIEPLASPDGICLTESVYQSVKSKLTINPRRIDEVDLKHIDDKYTIYKLPNKEEVVEDYQIELERTEVEVDSLENKTNFFKTYLKSLYIFTGAFIIGGLSGHLLIYIPHLIFGTYINSSENIIGSIKSDIPILILILVIFTVIFSKWKYKLRFKDIRHVSSLLDTLILNYGYEFYKQKKNTIEYLHCPKWSFFSNWLYRTKYYPKFLRETVILRIAYDGNTVEIEGMFYHIVSLLRNLKKHYKK